MKYQTTIDSISIQIDLTSEDNRNTILKEILSLLNSKNLYITHEDYSVDIHSNFYTREYRAVANNVVVVSLKSGSYSCKDRQTNLVTTTYYIALEFAGIIQYNVKLDRVANDALLAVCGYLNTRYITFRITGLDIALDIFTDYDKVLALCTKKSPTTEYYAANEMQVYETTTYIEKIPQHKQDSVVQKAYLYDKAVKEKLDYKLTRFEVKLQSQFFRKNRHNLFGSIMKALNKYHVMYVPNAKEKQRLKNEYDRASAMRQRDIKRIGFDQYRCYYDMTAIVGFINVIYTVR